MSNKKSLSDQIPPDASNAQHLCRIEEAKKLLGLYGTAVCDKYIWRLLDINNDTVLIGWGATRNKSILILRECLKMTLSDLCEVSS